MGHVPSQGCLGQGPTCSIHQEASTCTINPCKNVFSGHKVTVQTHKPSCRYWFLYLPPWPPGSQSPTGGSVDSFPKEYQPKQSTLWSSAIFGLWNCLNSVLGTLQRLDRMNWRSARFERETKIGEVFLLGCFFLNKTNFYRDHIISPFVCGRCFLR